MTLPSSPPGPPAPTTVPGIAPGTDLGTDTVAAARFAGRALLRNPLTLLGAGVLYSVLMVVVITVGFVLAMGLMIAMIEAGPDTGGELTPGQLVMVFAVSVGIVLVALPVGTMWQAGTARAGGVILEGGRPSFGEALIGRGRVLVTALLVLALTMIGTILLYVPGLIAAVLFLYAIPASARGASPLAALKESVSLVRSHLGTSILGALLVFVASNLSSMIIIGVIAAIPFTVLFQMGLYERVSGREIPEPAQA